MIKSNWSRYRTKILVGLVVAQAIFLIGVALSFYAVGWYGKEIRLQTVPIDPRDLLYGDSVVLQYDINQMDIALWKGPGIANDNRKLLYVVLKPDPTSKYNTYKAVGIYDKKPDISDDEVILRGHSDYSDTNKIHVRYGLENYYLPQNTGKELEEKANKGNVVTKIKIAPWGRAILEDIELQ